MTKIAYPEHTEDKRNGLEVPPSSTDTSTWDTDDIPVHEDIIRSFLGSYSRDPFQRQLAKLLGASPDRNSILAFAKRNPDRWARCVQIFASLAGYTEKIEVEHNFNIDAMSDAEVERRLSEVEALLRGTSTVNQPMLDKPTILEAEEVPPPLDPPT